MKKRQKRYAYYQVSNTSNFYVSRTKWVATYFLKKVSACEWVPELLRRFPDRAGAQFDLEVTFGLMEKMSRVQLALGGNCRYYADSH